MIVRFHHALTLTILACVAPLTVWAETVSDSALDFILKDAVARGHLARANWKAVPIRQGSTSGEMSAAVDRPLVLPPAPTLQPGLTAALGRLLRFGEPVLDAASSTRSLEERRYLRRILFRRHPLPFRYLLGVPEFTDPLEPSEYVVRYFDLLKDWAKSVDEVRNLERSGAPTESIEYAKTKSRKKLHALEHSAHGQIVRVASIRFSAFSARAPQLAWSAAIELYQLYASSLETLSSESAASIIDRGEGLEWSTVILPPAMSGQKIDYQIRKIRRLWVEDTILFFRPWVWSNASPFSSALSNGSDCTPVAWVSCVAERVVISRVSEPNGASTEVVLGLVGEVLPVNPSEEGKSDAIRPNVGHSDYRASTVLDRLRDGTF